MTHASDFFDIDLDKSTVLDLDENWENSKGYSREQMQQWIEQIREIQHLCQEQGYSHGDFEKMRDSSDPLQQSLGETYYKFYDHEHLNHDYIKADWIDNHYEFTNGRHRVSLAKQAGLRHLPAYVTAPDQETLARLKADGERISVGETPKQQSATPLWERKSMSNEERLARLKSTSNEYIMREETPLWERQASNSQERGSSPSR